MGEVLVQLAASTGLPVLLIILARITGRAIERKHFRSLDTREAALSDMVLTDLRSFPGGSDASSGGEMVIGEVVISSDYLKSFMARLRKILGGELKSFHSLMVRARREAILRMMEKAHGKGFNAVCNIRVEFANVGGVGMRSADKRGVIMVAIIVSGTAYSIPAGVR